jgi:type IV secretory pathway TrbL component
MPRITRARMNAEAEYLETVAAPRADAAAADGERAAADPAATDHARACAARAAEIARGDAAEYRTFAAALRDGEIPDGLRLD